MRNAFAAIVFAGKKLAQLEFLQLVNQAVVFGRDFFLRLRAMQPDRFLPQPAAAMRSKSSISRSNS